MKALLDRRVIAVLGAVVALLLAILLGYVILGEHKAGVDKADQAGSPGLQIEQGQADSRTSATKPLRCFVNGQFVGMATVAECAQKNGVAAQALDVGLDPATGEATSANGSLAPPVQAPPPAAAAPPPTAVESPASAPPPLAECMRFAADGWRGAGSGLSLGQCARALFDGRCDRMGEALYGRWGSQTLRLVPGRVEISPDNRNFRPLVPQNPQDCSLPEG